MGAELAELGDRLILGRRVDQRLEVLLGQEPRHHGYHQVHGQHDDHLEGLGDVLGDGVGRNVGEQDLAVVQRLGARMQGEAFRVNRVIEDLLDLSRLEGEAAARYETVPVHAMVDEALEKVWPAASGRDVHLSAREVPRSWSVLGDRRQLVSALANLLENAVKYSDDGSTVELSAGTDGTSIGLVVEDHGIGIPPRELDRIFERFYRVDRGRGRDTGGTGLGLSIVRHVAVNHGGEVRVTSVEGQGSAFTLWLPAEPGPMGLVAEAG